MHSKRAFKNGHVSHLVLVPAVPVKSLTKQEHEERRLNMRYQYTLLVTALAFTVTFARPVVSTDDANTKIHNMDGPVKTVGAHVS